MAALRKMFLERTYELYFVELRNKLTALTDFSFDVLCPSSRLRFSQALVWSLVSSDDLRHAVRHVSACMQGSAH
jgi:hypothetical protein